MKTLDVLEKVLKGKILKKNTIRRYRYTFDILNDFSQDFPTSAGEMNEFLSWVTTNKHLNDYTTQSIYITIHSAASYMTEFYDLPFPFKKGMKPHVSHREHRIFKAEQIGLIINACQTDEERALVLTFIDSSCRASDLANLKGKMINDNSFTVPGKEGVRTYRLDPKLCQVLKKMAGDPENCVFRTHTNKLSIINTPLTPSALSLRVRYICLRAGLTGEKLGAHTLRHSSGSLIARKTGSLLAVKAALQHSKASTSEIYIHEVEEELQQQTSPLQLFTDEIFKSNSNINLQQSSMLTSGTSTEVIPLEQPTTNKVDELLQSSYPLLPEDFDHITARLNKEDVELIRRAFICLAQFGQLISDGADTRKLYRRMLRKVKTTLPDIRETHSPYNDEPPSNVIYTNN